MSIEHTHRSYRDRTGRYRSGDDFRQQQRLGAPAEAVAEMAKPKRPPDATPTATAKRGPGRPPKPVTNQPIETAEPAASAPSAPSAPVVEATKPAAAPVVATTSDVSKEKLSKAMSQLIKANLRDTVVKILGEHGAGSISALAPSEYAAAYAKSIAATPAEFLA